MAFQPVPLCSIVELIYTWNSQRVENTLWMKRVAPPSAAELETLGELMITWWTAALRPSLSSDLILVQVDCTYKGVDTGPQAIVTTGLPSAGAAPTESVTNGTAFVVKFGTDFIGRSYRGRNYVPGLPTADYNNSLLAPATVASIMDGYNALTGVLDGTGWEHVVVSRFSGGASRPSGVSTAVTSYTNTTTASRSQRRRNPGVGA